MQSLLVSSRRIKIGERRNNLTLLGHPFRIKQGSSTSVTGVFGCDCGNITASALYHVARGTLKTCGCVKPGNVTHGYARKGQLHPLYYKWRGMRRRCNNPKHERYEYYGGRGIRVCKEWDESFEVFVEWAMANGWKPGLEIDRYPDNDGNYEPGNVRFATRAEQLLNYSRNVLLTAFGETKTVKEWAEDKRCVVQYATLLQRAGAKWDHTRAIITPPFDEWKVIPPETTHENL